MITLRNKISVLIMKIYKISRSPRDVDIYTGGLAEMPVKGGIIGPLLTCLIGDQFVRMKKGDSFWYERTKGPQKFSSGRIRFDRIKFLF